MTLRPLRSSAFRPLVAFSAALLLIASARPAAAQGESRFSGFIERLDRDGNKTLDPSELSQIQGPFRGMLESSGVDLSRSISTDDLIDRMRRRSEQSGRDGGRDSGRDSGGRDSGGRDSGGRDGGRDSGRFGGFGRDSGGSSREMGRDSGDHRPGSPTPSGPAHTAVPKSIVKREKTLVALPSQYAAGDTDRDGQLALSEWKAWKGRAALAEFSRLDTNGDGFLTPRELVAASKGTAIASAGAAAAAPAVAATTAPAGATTGTPAAAPSTATPAAPEAKPGETKSAESKPGETKPAETKPGETKPGEAKPAETRTEPAKPAAASPKAELDEFSEFDGSEASTPVPAEPTGKAADDAKRYFDLLDKDADGKVGVKEWAASTRIRTQFTNAKIDLTQPIPRSDFIVHYVRLNP